MRYSCFVYVILSIALFSLMFINTTKLKNCNVRNKMSNCHERYLLALARYRESNKNYEFLCCTRNYLISHRALSEDEQKQLEKRCETAYNNRQILLVACQDAFNQYQQCGKKPDEVCFGF